MITPNYLISFDNKVLILESSYSYIGLVGIATWHLGAKRTVMTDADTHTLQKMRENVHKNCNVDDATNHNNTLECKQLIWGSPHMEKFKNEHGVYDTILAADVIYTNSSIEPLFDTVACLLKPNGIFVLSRYNKWFGIEDAAIIGVAEKKLLHCSLQPSEGILIFSWSQSI